MGLNPLRNLLVFPAEWSHWFAYKVYTVMKNKNCFFKANYQQTFLVLPPSLSGLKCKQTLPGYAIPLESLSGFLGHFAMLLWQNARCVCWSSGASSCWLSLLQEDSFLQKTPAAALIEAFILQLGWNAAELGISKAHIVIQMLRFPIWRQKSSQAPRHISSQNTREYISQDYHGFFGPAFIEKNAVRHTEVHNH